MTALRAYTEDGDVYLHAGDIEHLIRSMADKARGDLLGALTAPVADSIADAINDWAKQAAS